MKTEEPTNSSSESTKDDYPTRPQDHKPANLSRKKKVLIFFIITGAAAYGALSYLNESPDPTTWESMRTDYKNTK